MEAAVAVGELELCEEARHARVVCSIALAAGPLSKGAGEPRLAQSAFPSDEKIAFFRNPVAGRELLKESFVELARRAVVDVLDRSLAVAQARGAQPDLRAFGRAIGDLAVEQECEPFGVGEVPGGVLPFELEKGVGHAVELQGSELVEGGMGEHLCLLLNGRRWGRGCCRERSPAPPRLSRAVCDRAWYRGWI